MASFKLTDAALRRLLEQNQIPVPGPGSPEDGLVVVALRGCVPAGARRSTAWSGDDEMELASLDYRHLRCSVVLWDVAGKQVRAFLASTVPHLKHLERARKAGGVGANQNMEGGFTLVKGPHPWTGRTSHRALRQLGARPLQRTQDDLDIDGLDRVEIGDTANNCHASYANGPLDANYESAGCTVVEGSPKTAARPRPASGAWAEFDADVYDGRGKGQQRFRMVLVKGLDARRAVEVTTGALLAPRLRWGSQGPLVEAWQRALVRLGFLKAADVDARMGQTTFRATLAFQVATFGALAGDGIVGPATAAAAGFENWPPR